MKLNTVFGPCLAYRLRSSLANEGGGGLVQAATVIKIQLGQEVEDGWWWAEDDEEPNLKGRVFFVVVAQWSIKTKFPVIIIVHRLLIAYQFNYHPALPALPLWLCSTYSGAAINP